MLSVTTYTRIRLSFGTAREWLELHEEELMENWNRIQDGRPGEKIALLE